MSCISKEGRCSKCCEAIHIPTYQWIAIRKGRNTHPDSAKVKKHWVNISKRRAKKINPYVFEFKDDGHKNFIQVASFFTCRRLVKGVGCSIRDSDSHPEVCKIYTGGVEYSPTCEQDINIIARSGG